MISTSFRPPAFRSRRVRASWRLVLPLLLLWASANASPAPLLRGDTDLDGRVNVSDAILILKAAANLLTPDASAVMAGDVDPVPGTEGRAYGDRRLTVGDAVRILRYSVGLMTAAQFYAGEAPTVDPQSPSLQLNMHEASRALFGSPAGTEATLSVNVVAAEDLSMGGVNLTLLPLDGAPDLHIVKVERGALLPVGVDLLTTPSDLSTEGRSRVRTAFSRALLSPIQGYGELFRITVKSQGAIPPAAAYRVRVDRVDFASGAADTLMVPPLEKLLTAGGD